MLSLRYNRPLEGAIVQIMNAIVKNQTCPFPGMLWRNQKQSDPPPPTAPLFHTTVTGDDF